MRTKEELQKFCENYSFCDGYEQLNCFNTPEQIIELMNYLTEEEIDTETAHIIADDLLVRYIEITNNNEALIKSYYKIGKWYA